MFFKRSLFLVAILALTRITSFAQINEKGIPIIKNFNPVDYDFADQNWCAVQDHRGIMYFGNQEGYVLEFDGKSFRKILIPESRSVRSMAVDSLGTVYVGTVGDFGYLKPDLQGNLHYESLSHLITDSVGRYGEIWKTYSFGQNVYFQTFLYIFLYNGQTIKTISIPRELRLFFSHKVNNNLYLNLRTVGLKKLEQERLADLPEHGFFKDKIIYSIVPIAKNNILVVTGNGFFAYNPSTGESRQVDSPNSFLGKMNKEGLPYHNILLNDSTLALGRVLNSFYSLSRVTQNGNPIEIINAENGLMDEMVTYLYQRQSVSGSAPLWMCLNKGIAKADIHSPIRRFNESSGVRGQILDIIRFNGRLFLATMAGVYYQDYDSNGLAYFKQIPEINSTTWSFQVFKDPQTGKERLMASGDHVFEITPALKGIYAQENLICYKFIQLPNDSKRLYVGATGLFYMEKSTTGWLEKKRVKPSELRSEVRHMAQDKWGNLWLTTKVHGIQKVLFTQTDTVVTNYDTNHGLPSLTNLSVFKIGEETIFGTTYGLYKFNYDSNFFEPYSLPSLPERLKSKGISKFFETPDGFLIVFQDNKKFWLEKFVRKPDGSYDIVSTPFKAFPTFASDAIYAEPNGMIWYGVSTELYSYNPNIVRDYSEPFYALIRKVSTKGDSIVFHGSFVNELPSGKTIVSLTQPQKQVYKFPYRFNSFTFEVASTFFENESAIEYSYILEGNDKEWSRWSAEPRPIYTNLFEGNYTFKMKARNVFGTESYVAEYRFSISPPWFRSIIAYISYVLFLVGFIWFIVKWNTRRLIAEKERLEEIVRQRTAEVVAQKEEIEKQNEELEIQRDKIFEQNEEIKSSITYASRIQNALLTPDETIKNIFDDFFILFLPRDIVSGDFYWFTQIGTRKICAAADCTGHGVPGGFMSMLGMGLLNQIISRNEKITASEILDQLRSFIITSLHQTGRTGENKDGMDIALYVIDTQLRTIEFAGANNPLVVIRNNEVIQIKGDKMPIGIHLRCDVPFTNHVMEYMPGDVVYTFSDGYQDQFGGPDQRKFMVKNLKELLLSIHKFPMSEQRDILHRTLLEWHGDSSRIDDVVLIGVKL